MKKLVIRGYYGNGNCGDEALLQTMHGFYSSAFQIVVSVNKLESALSLQKQGVFPYKSSEVCGSLHRGLLANRETVGMILGGGGLGLGFGWDQYMFAWRNNKKIIHAGVHITGEFYKDSDESFNQVSRNFLAAADWFSVRHRHSIAMCSKIGVKARYLPDWAFALPVEPANFVPHRDYVVVVIRSDTNKDRDLTLKTFEAIQGYASKNALDIVIIPFDGSDENMTKRLGLDSHMLGKMYFEPKKVKSIISHSKAVFSLGRYHPLVFAMASDVPVFSIDALRQDRSDDKTCLQLTEEGLEDFHFPLNRLNQFNVDSISALVQNYNTQGKYTKRFLSYGEEVTSAALEISEILAS